MIKVKVITNENHHTFEAAVNDFLAGRMVTDITYQLVVLNNRLQYTALIMYHEPVEGMCS